MSLVQQHLRTLPRRIATAEKAVHEVGAPAVAIDAIAEARCHLACAATERYEADQMAAVYATERAMEAAIAAAREARKAAAKTPAPQEPAAPKGKQYAVPAKGADTAKGAPSILARDAGEAARALKSKKRYVYQILGDGDLEGTGEDLGTFGSLRRALERAGGWGAKEWTLERVHVADMAAYDRDEVGMVDWQPIAVMEADE